MAMDATTRKTRNRTVYTRKAIVTNGIMIMHVESELVFRNGLHKQRNEKADPREIAIWQFSGVFSDTFREGAPGVNVVIMMRVE